MTARSLLRGLSLALLGHLFVSPTLPATELPYLAGATVGSVTQALNAVPGDVDGDGDLDLLAGGQGSGGVRWLENDGTASGWPVHLLDPVAAAGFDSRHVALADLDGDGDLDALAGGLGEPVTWWANPGGTGATGDWAPTPLATGTGTTFDDSHGVAAGDLDGDGDLDVVAANAGLGWWENTAGDASAWAFTDLATLATVSEVRRPALADLDRDGDLDLVTAGGSLGTSTCWYENTAGDASAFTRHVIASGLTFDASSLEVADVNGDGAPDVLVTIGTEDDASGEVAWFETDGTRHDLDLAFPKTQWAAAGDLDADGDLDVVATSWTEGATPGAVAWWENGDAAGTAWTRHTLATGNHWMECRPVDLDGDGDLDVAVAQFGAVHWFENDSLHRSAVFNLDPPVTAPPHRQVLTSTEPAIRFLEAADVDRDGDPDLVSGTGGPSGFVAWWQNPGPGAGAWTRHEVAALITLNAGGFGAADLDRDGDLDLLQAIEDKIYQWENTDGAGGTWSQTSTSRSGGGTLTQLSTGDVDGDGDTDLAFGDNHTGEHVWWENADGGGSTWTEHGISTGLTVPLVSYSRLADLDGDGDLDLLVPRSVRWLENDDPTNVSSWTAHPIPNTVGNTVDVEPVDLDGDGDLDVASVAGGDLVWWENADGTATSWIEHLTPVAAFSVPHRVRAWDLDADGDRDLVVSDTSAGSATWFENTDGAGTFASPGHPVAVSFGFARALAAGDFDREGDLDLAVAAQNDDTLAVFENRGGHFALPTTDLAPATIGEGQLVYLLEIEARHRGRAGDRDLEMANFELRFEDDQGTLLTVPQLTALFDTLYLVRDDPDNGTPGEMDAADELLDPVALSTSEWAVEDGDPGARVSFTESPGTFLLLGLLNPNASHQTPSTFQVTHVRSASSTAEDADHDLPLALESADDVGTGAIEVLPTTDVSVTKSNGDTHVAPGGTTTWEIGVSHFGFELEGIQLVDPFPADATCRWQCTFGAASGCDVAGGTWYTTPLSVTMTVWNETLKVLVECTLDGDYAGATLSNTATVSVPAGYVDSDPSNDMATDTDDVTSCGEPVDLVIPSQTVTDAKVFTGCQTVTAEDPFVVGAGGDVTLRAGTTVILGDGFQVESGGSLTVEIDPSLDD